MAFVLAKLESHEIIIGERTDGKGYLHNCLLVDVDVDKEDCCKFIVEFYPVFGYLSDDPIDIDEDFIIYKTEKIDTDIVNQYKEIVKNIKKQEKIKTTLININKNVKDRKG
jgi:hypothetical protein